MRRVVVLLVLSACGGGSIDGGGDAAVPDAPVPTPDAPPVVVVCDETLDHPDTLSCTGLYSDFAARTLAPGVRAFKPGFELWSDGAAKSRWIKLPSAIDGTNPNEWVFPVGTKIWKEFSVAGRTIETRLLWKKTEDRWIRAVYLWREDGSRADEIVDGMSDVPGTGGYGIPTQGQCSMCHDGRVDSVLGFDAVLMSAPEATGLTYAELLRLGLLTTPLQPERLQIPGNAVERTALGVLHANCGVTCHNLSGLGGHFGARLDVREDGTLGTVATTDIVATAVNQKSVFRPQGAVGNVYRIRPTDLERSMIVHRMAARGTVAQMPPLATKKVDAQGLAAVSAWVSSMTAANGYPEPGPIGGAADAGMPDAGGGDAPMAPDAAVPDAPLATPDARIDAPLPMPDAKLDAPIVMPDAPPPDAPSAPDAPPSPDAPPGCTLPALELHEVATGLSNPLFVVAPLGDGTRLFVVQKGGTVRLIKNGALQATPFITVSDWFQPSQFSEGGLLGMALHPDYNQNGRFYLHYTRTPDGNVVVREFARDPDNADKALTTPVKTFLDTDHGGWNHVGGMLAFGSDGHLYDGLGDAANSSNARDLTVPLGKILRFDVDDHPTAPAGNVTGAGNNPYIWNYGLRNPWRFSFDRGNGRLYIGDVGQDLYEEIDVQTSGHDYGWPIMEGLHCYQDDNCTPTGVLPVVEHSHDSGEAGSIVGGYVYRGDAIPCLRGRYVYGDYETSRIFSFVLSGGVATDPIELTSDLNPGASPASNFVSFGEDAAGELYVVDLGSGKVFKIQPE